MSVVDQILAGIERPDNGQDGTALDDTDPFLDWNDLFTEDTPETEWLFEDVFALGRGHALYAGHKEGKSLFTLWVCFELATRRTDVDVVYLDYEMSRADVKERAEDMGYGVSDAAALQARFHYALLPSLPPLDTGEGAGALLRMVDRVERPGCHVFVVVDTTGRAVEGDENSNDTIRAFYKWTGMTLKRRGVTWARLDHAGKDPTKGQRGGSAKGDDVDVVWRLQKADNGVTLYSDAARMAWVPEKVTYAIQPDPLRYTRTGDLWPAGTKELARDLDTIGVPRDAGRPAARAALKAAGRPARTKVLAAAIRWRRMEAQLSQHEWDSPNIHVGDSAGDSNPAHALTWGDSAGDSGDSPPVDTGDSPPSLEGDSPSRSEQHRCSTCGGPAHPPTTHTFTLIA